MTLIKLLYDIRPLIFHSILKVIQFPALFDYLLELFLLHQIPLFNGLLKEHRFWQLKCLTGRWSCVFVLFWEEPT